MSTLTLTLMLLAPAPPDDTADVVLGVNAMQPLAFGIGSTFFDHSSLVPVPLEAHVRINDLLGVGVTVLYRHHTDATLALQEIAAAVGPRVTLWGDGLRGLFVAGKLGLGFAGGDGYFGESYHRFDLMLQFEAGYALHWDVPGIYLLFGGGLLTLVPLLQSPEAIAWNSLGKVFQYYQPVVNVTVGWCL